MKQQQPLLVTLQQAYFQVLSLYSPTSQFPQQGPGMCLNLSVAGHLSGSSLALSLCYYFSLLSRGVTNPSGFLAGLSLFRRSGWISRPARRGGLESMTTPSPPELGGSWQALSRRFSSSVAGRFWRLRAWLVTQGRAAGCRRKQTSFRAFFQQRVRMAEWSKAPDSRCVPCLWVFWSPDGGVGSNPTSDM